MRGVNLGSWLVLERWITPSVFTGSEAQDEYNLRADLTHHRDTYITEKDFADLAKHGVEAVRLPVGHWIFGGFEPYTTTEKYVTLALEWAKKHNLHVLLDLHTAPGSQNGEVHSGKIGEAGWHLDPRNIEQTIEIVGKIAQKYGQHPNVWGIEVLNEPTKDIPLSVLQDYYRQAYQAVKRHCNKKVVFNDAYRPIAEWEDFITEPDMVLDVHLYQISGTRNLNMTFDEHIAKCLQWQRMLEEFGPQRMIVGEWSAVLPNGHPDEFARNLYIQAQEYAFAGTLGHFYWTYKTEVNDDWNYRTVRKFTAE